MSLGNSRGYRPTIPLPNYDVKLLKPQNILGMLAAGTRDLGFAGADWIAELGIEGLVEVLDTGLDPVRIVAAAPNPRILAEGAGGLGGRKLIVASEYGGLTAKWLASRGLEAHFLRAYGATESLPPEDADIIVDNAATGSTLRANGLEIIDSLMNSTTRLYASAAAWAHPGKRARIERLVLLLKAVLEARKRLMISFNIPSANLETLLDTLPSCVLGAAHTQKRARVHPGPAHLSLSHAPPRAQSRARSQHALAHRGHAAPRRGALGDRGRGEREGALPHPADQGRGGHGHCRVRGAHDRALGGRQGPPRGLLSL